MKKILKTLLLLTAGLIICVFAAVLYRMYKPVVDASKMIEEVRPYARNIEEDMLCGNPGIIGLGEATHGNHEFQELKLDVLKILVQNNGVTAICFEMDYAEGVLVNDYITNQTDMTIEELFSHISFDIYHTEEIKALIEWMHAYNTASEDAQLEFYGYDLQNPETDVYVISEFVKANHVPDASELNQSLEAFLTGEFRFRDERSQELFDALESCKEELSGKQYRDCYNVDKVQKCIDNVFQAKELAACADSDLVAYGTYRDQAMAETVLEISDTVGSPIMITGHNGHVGYAGSYVKTMGSYLKEARGEDYFVIGTDYFKTTASVQSGRTRKKHTAYSADPLAYQAKALGTYYLEFDAVKEDPVMNAIVTEKMPTGSLGETFSFLNHCMPGSVRVYAPPAELFDAMLFVYKATPFTELTYE